MPKGKKKRKEKNQMKDKMKSKCQNKTKNEKQKREKRKTNKKEENNKIISKHDGNTAKENKQQNDGTNKENYSLHFSRSFMCFSDIFSCYCVFSCFALFLFDFLVFVSIFRFVLTLPFHLVFPLVLFTYFFGIASLPSPHFLPPLFLLHTQWPADNIITPFFFFLFPWVTDTRRIDDSWRLTIQRRRCEVCQ